MLDQVFKVAPEVADVVDVEVDLQYALVDPVQDDGLVQWIVSPERRSPCTV